MDNTPAKKRKLVTLTSANPLFEQWLLEWMAKAARVDSNKQYHYKNALKSLYQYPMLLESGFECKKLKNFNDEICYDLDQKLLEYTKNIAGDSAQEEGDSKETKRLRWSTGEEAISLPEEEFLPQKGSGSYAILFTLYEHSKKPNYRGFSTKKEIQQSGHHLLDNKSFQTLFPGSKFTAWSSLKTLLDKKLVNRRRANPAKFSLTIEGKALVKNLIDLQDEEEEN